MNSFKTFVTIMGLFVLVILTSAIPSEDEDVKAIVRQRNGTYFFISSEPVDPYEVLFSVEMKITLDNLGADTVDEIMEALKRQADKKDVEYDALILNGNGGARAISFTE